ncbi:MAG: glycoside hydrolase family 3 N-terminal domain-containing protein, partial [Pseudanabaena sp.]
AMGRVTAEEALAIGLNWVLAPIVDINNNPKNPVINVRSFGITVGEVMRATQGFIAGAKQYPVLTTAKHFPGHGDTAVDSHLQTPTLTHDRSRFENLEFLPFCNAISAGVDAIMSAHIFAPNLDPQNIATLSPHILTEILRDQLGFEGLITTDALIMSGVANLDSPEAIAVQAVKAGADILLMPVDPITTIHAVCKAVESGEISRDRIKQSVQRIWQAKQKVCGLPTDLTQLGKPENLEIAKEIATKSISVYSVIPHLQYGDSSKQVKANYLNLIIVDDPLTCGEFLNARSPAVLLPKNRGYQRIIADGMTLDHLQLKQFTDVIIQMFSRGNPFRGNTDLNAKTQALVNTLLASEKLEAMVVYGSPYALDPFLQIFSANIPWGFAYSQQPEAQATVLQNLGFG